MNARTPATVRDWLEDALARVVSGEEITPEELRAAPSTGWDEIQCRSAIITAENAPAHVAWLELHQWASDEDIRRKEPAYGERRRERLKELLAKVKALPRSSEISN